VAGNTKIRIQLEDSLPSGVACYVRYGLSSFVKNIDAPVLSVYRGEDSSRIEIEFASSVLQQLLVLNEEGAFYLHAISAGKGPGGKVLVRSILKNKKGNIVLKAETDGPRVNPLFVAGEHCFVSRIFAYGNIRDSDPETSTFRFSDASYGKRTGRAYPLYNWCVIFQDLPIK
jgi:hypothetical protein